MLRACFAPKFRGDRAESKEWESLASAEARAACLLLACCFLVACLLLAYCLLAACFSSLVHSHAEAEADDEEVTAWCSNADADAETDADDVAMIVLSLCYGL